MRIILCLFVFLLFACNQKPKNYTPSTKKPATAKKSTGQTPTDRYPAQKAPEQYKYQPQVLTGNEIQSKELRYQDGANNQRIAHLNGSPFTGVAIYQLPDGSIFTYETFKEGVKDGPYRTRLVNTDDDGNTAYTMAVGTFKNGLNDGIYLEYYDGANGPLKYEYHYSNGRKMKSWNSYYRNGSQWTRRDFNNDIIVDKVLVWDTDGTLTKESTYKNGQLIYKKDHYKDNE